MMSARSARCWLCAVLLFGTLASVRGQDSKPVVLEHADSLVGRVIDGEDARELIGNVRIAQEEVRIACDRALQYVVRGIVVLRGNVVVRDDSVTMKAPRAIYDRTLRRAEAFESVLLDDGTVTLRAGYGEYLVDSQKAFFRLDVVVRDSLSTVEADSVTYYRTDRRSIATGHVIVRNLTDRAAIAGRRLDHDAARAFSMMTGEPVFLQVDTAAGGRNDTLLVRSKEMLSYRDSIPRLIAIDSVRILRGDLAATASFARFFTLGDSIELRGTPVIWYGATQVSGDSVNVFLRKRKLRHAMVFGNAMAVSRPDSPFTARLDQLAGETLALNFGDSTIENIVADMRAVSIYHLYEDSLANGLNRSSGDRITLRFTNGRVHEISIVGGVEGQYVPEHVLLLTESEYRLPGLLWREQRPTIPLDQRQWHRIPQQPQ